MPRPQGVVRESKILVITNISDFRTTTQAEGHHTTKLENRIEQFERIAAFLDEHVQ